MFCRKCGNQLSDHMKFCPKCGTSVITQPAQDTQATAASAETAVPVTQTAAAPTETTVSAETTAPVAEATAMPDATAATTAGQATQILQTAQPTSPVAPMPPVAQATPAAQIDAQTTAAPTAPAPAEKKNGGMKWVFIGIAAVLLIAAIVFVLVFFLGRNGKDTTTDGTVEETEVSRSKKGEVSFDFRSITTEESLEGVTILVMGGHSNTDGEPLETLTTDGDGRTSVELDPGEYTLVWKKDGYYNGCRDLDIENDAVTVSTHMIPLLSGNEAYILLQWASDLDLDLCVFNAQTNQYISITSPVDAAGNFLYGDNTGEQGYELIHLKDYLDGIYTIFVRDNNSLANGTGSSMEAGTVSVSIYVPDGLIYYKEADTAEDAALWNPAYLYEGAATDLNNYIHDTTDYPQLAQDKNNPTVASNAEAMSVYEAFLRGEYTTVDGKTLTGLLPELSPLDDSWDGYVDRIEYAYLDLGGDGIQELLVTFVGMDIYNPGDDSTYACVLRYDGTGLKMCYDIYAWARSGYNISYYGVVNGGGSGGAATYYFDQTVLNANGEVLPIFSATEEYVLSAYTGPFYEDGFDPTSFSDMPDAGICFYEINDSYYLVYTDDLNVDRASYEEVSAFYGSHGYQIYTQDEIDAILAEQVRSLGIEDRIINDSTEPQIQELDPQYYQEFVNTEDFALTEETTRFLEKVAYGLYSALFTTDDFRSARTEGYYFPDSLLSDPRALEAVLWNIYYGSGESFSNASYPYYSFYRTDGTEVENLLRNLFGGTYDLTALDSDVNFESGCYYTDGQLVAYMAEIGQSEIAVFQSTKDDDYYRQYCTVTFKIEQDYEGVTGTVTLSLHRVNNDLGYVITSIEYAHN